MSNHSIDQYIQHIEFSPDIAGHRITVQDIVIWHQHMGKGVDEICAEYNLTPADVHAALTWYFDNREAIDRSISDSDDFVKMLRNTTPSVLEKRLKEMRG